MIANIRARLLEFQYSNVVTVPRLNSAVLTCLPSTGRGSQGICNSRLPLVDWVSILYPWPISVANRSPQNTAAHPFCIGFFNQGLSCSMASFSVAGKVELNGRSATLTLPLPQSGKFIGQSPMPWWRASKRARSKSIQAANQLTRKSSAVQWTTCSACYFSKEEQKENEIYFVHRCNWHLS